MFVSIPGHTGAQFGLEAADNRQLRGGIRDRPVVFFGGAFHKPTHEQPKRSRRLAWAVTGCSSVRVSFWPKVVPEQLVNNARRPCIQGGVGPGGRTGHQKVARFPAKLSPGGPGIDPSRGPAICIDVQCHRAMLRPLCVTIFGEDPITVLLHR